ncbi:MAG TPA: adenylate cyclase [Leeuwenhoekiella sp.]|uniref:CYTH domain-containing protein n=1 Tax=Leeuwenhoekiella palythoae TaxID=573501 RepID=UPI000C4C597F|nr:CYTH domain-containing protein [Leeuwenhoekiella palythoae]MAS20187.1 adenylate cyclase [Leeuwenhoekiella sp.]MBH12806.1 adenylate cyclase [Leeuwenhoekiella sp.]UBZ11956.1 CYTH domain-containing protein [Leeuwenhoekiella palythoae]HAX14860.1 adenylate cyclase [Leeuwenhoekiella sp.]HBO29737.1 adenylate cyclase [Leeuwenhoekiella sp.]|tara:strand:+ start:1554 stop:2024 length:471 start_codon:yes stop_codon:yes gene_type:complete
MLEIERKFLVKNDAFKSEAFREHVIKQGYLNSNPERAVRVRIKDDSGFLTIKGKSDDTGTTRFEWEKEISREEAEALLKLCEPGVISKVRFLVKAGQHTFEVDEFFEENQGLLLAEIELQSATEDFNKPDWLGEEVTGDPRYYNSQLSKNPFVLWK